MTQTPLKVAVLTNRIPSYRVPVFLPLARKPGLQFKFFLSLPIEQSSSLARAELELRYSRGIRVGLKTHGLADSFQIPISLAKDLVKFKPDLIISGELGLPSLVGLLVAKLCRSRFVVWSEEIAETARPIIGAQRALRRFLIPRVRAFLAWGQPACNYLTSLGVPLQDIYYCAQAVDNDFWMKRSRAADRDVLRNELGFSGKVFLSVSRLIAPKGPDLLIDAWLAVPSEIRRGNRLVIVGEGELEALLRQKIVNAGGSDVDLVDFRQPDDLWKYYAAADCFVFPSTVDVWGLVVNEALACGCPVLASRHAGATQELAGITDQVEVFDPLDKNAFASILTKRLVSPLSSDPDSARAAISNLNCGVTTAAIERLIGDLYAEARTTVDPTGHMPT